MNNTNITFDFQEKIERANKDFCLFDGCKKILVGLSGGADSTCLLLSLKMLSEKHGFDVYAVHVNHMIRENEADRDELFARDLCKKCGIEFFCERVDVPAISKKTGQSLELCARNERYAAFERICRKSGITHVATAHNSCDNAETVLFNLVRGSGSRGLCGIPPKRSLCDGITLIRPLIYCSREEIERFLGEFNQTFVTDSTNADTEYTRNFIRGEILPRLRKINPSVEDAVMRSANAVKQDLLFLDKLAEDCESDSLCELALLDKCILTRIVRKMFSAVSSQMPEKVHIDALCERIYEYGKDNTVKCGVAFPDSVLARFDGGRLVFVKDERKKKNEKEEFCLPLSEGELFFKENPYSLYITFDVNKDIPQTLEFEENIYKKVTTDYLYFATIPSALCVRNRREGDRIYSGKMHKSIKKLFALSDINGEERNLLPLVCDGGKILCIPSAAVSDDCRTESNECICVTLYKKINFIKE